MSLLIMLVIPLQAEDDFLGIFCPGDKYVDCDDELWDLSIYGNAYYKSYSGTHDAGEPSVQYHLNTCNQGTIVRTWTVYTYGTYLSCSQTIHVGGSGGFSGNSIDWPDKKVEVSGCNPITDPYVMPDGYPTWDYFDCNMLARSYRDSKFYISGTCDKIVREWTVIDWCTYDPWTNPYEGRYKYYQTIKISVDDIPEISCPEDIYVDAFNCKDAYVKIDPYTLDPSSCGGKFTITNNSPYADKNGDDISGTYPVGETLVKYTIKYGCGKIKNCQFKVVVNDGKAPTPYCYAEMAIPLMGIDNNNDGINDEGMVEVWAKDLDFDSYAHCNNGPLKFSFSPDTSDSARIFTCDHLGENELQVWVTDAKGNQSYCLVILDIQNNGARIEPCQRLSDGGGSDDGVTPDSASMYSVQGLVVNAHDEPLTDIPVDLLPLSDEFEVTVSWDTTINYVADTIHKQNGSMLIRYFIKEVITEVRDTTYASIPMTVMSDNGGSFDFNHVAIEGNSYEVSINIDPQFYADIDFDDVDAIFDHLMSSSPFTTPQQFIAADVDGDGTISFLDMSYMLRLITGRSNDYPIGYGTTTINANMEFEQPEKAIIDGCPNKIMLETISEDKMDLTFMVIRLGELTDLNVANSRTVANTRSSEYWDKWMEHPQFRALMNPGASIIQKLSLTSSPNPFIDQTVLNIESPHDSPGQLSIFNIQGQRIISQKISLNVGSNQHSLNLENQPAGMYLYHLQVADQVIKGKLIKR